METIETLISESDSFIAKESFKYGELDLDRLLVVCNHLSDIMIKLQEDDDIARLKHSNREGSDMILLKEMITEDGKKKYTDKTAEAKISEDYQDINIEFKKTKYTIKTIDNKLKLLERKENLVKKVLNK